jgi:hypothetical protein
VACDQGQLDRFIESGLTDEGRGGAQLAGRGGAANGVPSTYSSDDIADLSRVTVTGRGTSTGVYISTLAFDGALVEATFPATVLPDGQPLRIHLDGGVAELRSSDGTVIATASLMTRRVTPEADRASRRPAGTRPRGPSHRTMARGAGRVVRRRGRGRASARMPSGRLLARTRQRARRSESACVCVRAIVKVTGFRKGGRGPAAYARITRAGSRGRGG